MPNLNKVFLIGHLGRDPEIKMSKGGTLYGNVSLATSFGRGDDKKTAWHRVMFFGQAAEYMRDNAHKGDALHVEGRIDYDEWEDNDGNKRYATKILTDRLQLLGKAPKKSITYDKAAVYEDVKDDDDVPF